MQSRFYIFLRNILHISYARDCQIKILLLIFYIYFLDSTPQINCVYQGSRKKKKVPPLVAGPLRGGEGGKGRATKEKRTFFETFFFILLPFKNKNYFTLDNLSKWKWKYHFKVCRQVFLLGCYNIFQKIGLFQSKNCGVKKSCQNQFLAILRLKKKILKKNSDGH